MKQFVSDHKILATVFFDRKLSTKIRTDQLSASNSYQIFREFEVLKTPQERKSQYKACKAIWTCSEAIACSLKCFKLITILYSDLLISCFVKTAEIFEVFRKRIPYILQKVFCSQHLVRIYYLNQVTPT